MYFNSYVIYLGLGIRLMMSMKMDGLKMEMLMNGIKSTSSTPLLLSPLIQPMTPNTITLNMDLRENALNIVSGDLESLSSMLTEN